MKQFLFALFLLVNAAPLFANDEGDEIAYIPSYQELVREGYGPRNHDYRDQYRDQNREQYLGWAMSTAPKPTQAYYGRGYTVYYGYTPVPVRVMDNNMLYAFGNSVEYYRKMMPASVTETNLSRYAVAVTNNYGYYGRNAVAARVQNANATTVVQSAAASPAPVVAKAVTSGTTALPAIGEKPPR